jgi:hypothetical protein
MKKGWLVVTLLLTLGLSGGTLFAQPAGLPSPTEETPMNRERAEELRERVELIWMWKLTEELNLTQEEGAKLFPLLRTYEERKRELRDENRKLVWELERMVEDNASEGAIKKTIRALEENDRKLQEVKQEGFDELGKILSVEKQAKYIVFHKHFRHEIHGLIKEARHKDRGPRRP